MNINLEFVAADNPTAQFEAAIQQAANILDAAFTDNITINLTIGYGEVNGELLTNGSAAAGPDPNGGSAFESYSTIRAALIAAASPGDSTFASLPSGSSINGQSTVEVWSAEEKALGQIPANGTGIDGSAGFAKDISSSLLVGVALHELTHALGRVPDFTPDVFEFFRYSSSGNRVFDDSIPASSASYFSLNGGATKWADYGVHSDPSDNVNNYSFDGDGPSSLTTEDAFDQFYDSNTLQYLTPFDLEQMDALGFHLKQDAPAANAYDFNGANSGDILLQDASGQIEYANMAGGSFQGMVQVANTPGWSVVGAGKIAGNVDSDIVIVNNASGEIFYRDMLPGGSSHWVDVTGASGYAVYGVGDINDDHYADIVIQNHSDGTILYANMANGDFNGWKAAGDTPGWFVVGVADVNDDGFADVIIQNQTDGTIFYGNMANGVFNNWVPMTGSQLPGWKVVGAGDIMRNGLCQRRHPGERRFDCLLQHDRRCFPRLAQCRGHSGMECHRGRGRCRQRLRRHRDRECHHRRNLLRRYDGWQLSTLGPGHDRRRLYRPQRAGK